MALTASAQNDLLKIELNDGTIRSIPVSDIRQMTFGVAEEDTYAGTYTGNLTVVVGGNFTYEADDHTVTVSENPDGTLKVELAQYSLAATLMGDLTIGSLVIDNIAYDESRQAYYRNYSADGLTRHFKAVKDGSTSMDKDYSLGETSEITLKFEGDNVEVQNDFKLGAMPFPLTSTFTGAR